MPELRAEQIGYPGARRPARTYRVDVGGLELHVGEWGHITARPVFLLHGREDTCRSFDAFAPMLSAAGYRVVAWDMRGCGDSDNAMLYSSRADVRDMLGVLDHVTSEPALLVGHSRGGRLMLELAAALPERVARLVCIDSILWHAPPYSLGGRDVSRDSPAFMAQWLDRRRTSWLAERRPGTIEELARRRRAVNPRLSTGWLRYQVTVSAAWERNEGWTWKNDIVRDVLPLDGCGRVWFDELLSTMTTPILAIHGTEPDPMGSGVPSERDLELLPSGSRALTVPAGHFAHIEKPELVAEAIAEFFAETAGLE